MKYDNRIILLKHKTRKGILMSRVDGVRYSSGEYIIQLDQDDDLYINNLKIELTFPLVYFEKMILRYNSPNKIFLI